MYIQGFHKNMEPEDVEAYVPSWAKEMGQGMWFETSQGRKAIHIEIEKQIFDKQTFVAPSLIMGHRGGCLASFLLVCRT